MSDGKPLSAVMQVDMTATDAVSTIDIVSPDGWQCKSIVREEGKPSGSKIRASFPITCSDGARGTLVVTWDNMQRKQYGAFTLNDGRSGKVIFDFKR